MDIKPRQIDMKNMLLQMIISICVSDVEGVKQLPPRLIGKLFSIFQNEQLQGAIIDFDRENLISIDVFIGVKYNINIQDKCNELQRLIKQEIEVITGYMVKSVNVYVDELCVK